MVKKSEVTRISLNSGRYRPACSSKVLGGEGNMVIGLEVVSKLEVVSNLEAILT